MRTRRWPEPMLRGPVCEAVKQAWNSDLPASELAFLIASPPHSVCVTELLKLSFFICQNSRFKLIVRAVGVFSSFHLHKVKGVRVTMEGYSG